MKARINRNFLEQTSFDSGMPSGLGVVIHKFETPGEYEIALVQDDRVIERVPLVVAADSAGRGAEQKEQTAALEGGLPSAHVSIDTGQAVLAPSATAAEAIRPYTVRAGGYLSFTATRHEDAAAIVARSQREGEREELFDSRRLNHGDMFAVTLVRPGRYELRNTETDARGQVTVAYPTVGDEPYRPPGPVAVECTDQGFSDSEIDLMPAQGIIFRIRTASRIQINLVEPDDGPQGARRATTPGWRKRPDPRGGTEGGSETTQA
jgi:hypothetical protein